MFIQTETTPNPATLKFLPGRAVLEQGTADFTTPEAAVVSPLATRVFGIDGVAGVFLGSDFVTVTKDDAVHWDHIKPALLGAIMEHFQSGAPVMEGAAKDGHAAHDGEDAALLDLERHVLLDQAVPELHHELVDGEQAHLRCPARWRRPQKWRRAR